MEKVRRRLKAMHDGDRQMVSILECVELDGLPTVEAACQEALDQGVFSSAVIINILARKRDPQPAAILSIPDALRLTHEPLAIAHVTTASGRQADMERSQILDMMTTLKLFGMRSAYDETMASGIKRQHEPPRIVGDLLQSEIAEKQARSIKYQITRAKLPLAKDINDFDFTNTPVK